MKPVFIFISLLSITGPLFGQGFAILTDQLIEPAKKQADKGFTEYDVGNIVLFSGNYKNYEEFYILDKNTSDKIYEYKEDEPKARHLYPRFFMTPDNPDLIIITMSLEGNYSWGSHIFMVDHNQVTHPGFLPYGADNFNFSALGLYCQFEQHDGWYIMFFQDNEKIIKYDTDELIDSSDLEFKIEKDKITRLNK